MGKVMKAILLVVMMACSTITMAQTKAPQEAPTITLDKISISDLIRLVYSEIFTDRVYIIDSSALAVTDVITVRLKGKNNKELQKVLEVAMKERGMYIESKGKVDMVKALPGLKSHLLLNDTLVVYRPKYRAVAYLRAVLSNFIPEEYMANKGKGGGGGSSTGETAGGGSSEGRRSQGGGEGGGGEEVLIMTASTQEEAKRLKEMVAQLDTPQEQVNVEAVLYEVGMSEHEGSAVAAAADVLKGHITVSIGDIGSQGNFASVRVGGMEAIIKALSTKGKFKIVSSTSLVVRSAGNARLKVGQDVPVLGAIQGGANGQAPIQSVEYRSSGVMLDVGVEVRRKMIDLTIDQQVSEFVATQTGVSASPTKQTRELQTSMSVRGEGEAILMGGLTSKKQTAGRSSLFNFKLSQEGDQTKTEMLLILYVRRLPAGDGMKMDDEQLDKAPE